MKTPHLIITLLALTLAILANHITDYLAPRIPLNLPQQIHTNHIITNTTYLIIIITLYTSGIIKYTVRIRQ